MRIDLGPLPWRSSFQDDPFSWTVKKRLSQDRNTMVVFLGDPRTGKSEAGKVTGEHVSINRPFRAKDVSFLPRVYIHDIQTAVPGDYKQFDEPGAEWGARSFMTVQNRMMNATHITFGSKLIDVGWAVPVLKMQDIIARMLAKFVFYMNSTGPRGMARFYQNWVNHYTGKTGRTRLGGCWFARAFQDRPEEEKEYLEMKKQYQDNRYAKYYQEFAKEDDEFKDKADASAEAIKKAIDAVVKNPRPYQNDRGRVVGRALKREFQLTFRDADEAARQINAILWVNKEAEMKKQGSEKP